MLRSSFRLARFPKFSLTEDKKKTLGEAEATAKGEAEEDKKTEAVFIINRGTSNLGSLLRKSSRRPLKPLGLNSQARGQHSPNK